MTDSVHIGTHEVTHVCQKRTERGHWTKSVNNKVMAAQSSAWEAMTLAVSCGGMKCPRRTPLVRLCHLSSHLVMSLLYNSFTEFDELSSEVWLRWQSMALL